MRLSVCTLITFLAAVLLAAPASAQDVPEADPADVESVDAIMTAVYDVISGPAGEQRDWERFRSLFRPEARLIPIGRPAEDAPVQPFYWSVDHYVNNVGPRLEESGFFEVEINRVEERYGHLAHIFSTYESRRTAEDEQPFARGINSFQLMHDGSRWWVVNIFWQSESPAFPIPEEYGG